MEPIPANSTDFTNCTDDSICIDGRCSNDTFLCECPLMYNPLDGCRSNYFDATSEEVRIGLFLMWVISGCVALFFILPRFKMELSEWKRKCGAPTVFLVTEMLIILVIISSMIAALTFLLRHAYAARTINTIVFNALSWVYNIIVFMWFTLILKAEGLGKLGKVWSTFRLVLLIVSSIGQAVALVASLLKLYLEPRHEALLGAISAAGAALGSILPVLVMVPTLIHGLVWVIRELSTGPGAASLRLMRRCTIVLLALSLSMAMLYIIILVVGALPDQLFDNITLRHYTHCIGFQVVMAGCVVFHAMARRKPKGSVRTNTRGTTGSTSRSGKSPANSSTPQPIKTESNTHNAHSTSSTVTYRSGTITPRDQKEDTTVDSVSSSTDKSEGTTIDEASLSKSELPSI